MSMSTKSEITEIALNLIGSAEMTEQMRALDWLEISDIIHIIMASRVSLEDKIPALRIVSAKLNKGGDAFPGWILEDIQAGIRDCDSITKIGEFALNERTNGTSAGTVFILTFHKGAKETYLLPFTTYEAAMQHLSEHAAKNNAYSSENVYYKIQKMIPDPELDGKMLTKVAWKLDCDGTVRTAHLRGIFHEGCGLSYTDREAAKVFTTYTDRGYVTSLGIPYRPGDMLNIDQRPLRKIIHAVIAKIVVDCDHYSARAIYTDNSRMRELSLRVHPGTPWMLPDDSGLHWLVSFAGELPDCRTPLTLISNYIKIDPSCGDEILKSILP